MKRIPILLYHCVTTEPPFGMERYTTSPTEFRAHLDAISESGATTIGVSDLVRLLREGESLPERLALVTFDDAYPEWLGVAAPELSARGMTATFYVTTGALGQGSSSLSATGLRELSSEGFEIGSHSHGHAQLDLLSREDLLSDLERCTKSLEEILQQPVGSFAYPHGYASRRVTEVLRSFGYSSACAVANGFSSPASNVYFLGRLTVMAETPTERIRSWLRGSGARTAATGPGPSALAWRMCRRYTPRLAAIRT